MNNVALTVALATAPSSAFAELRERPKFWFPLLLIVVSTAAIAGWYYNVVDIDWLKDLMFGNNPNIPEAQRAAAMGFVTRTTMLWSSVVGTFIAMPIVFVVMALYWFLAAKVTRLAPGYKHWFAFTCWTALPLLIGNVVAAIMLLISDSPQINPSVMQGGLSLNELVFNLPQGAPGQNILGSLSIPTFLSCALTIIGVHVWSQRSWLFSTIFALLPVVLFYGIWSLIEFR